MVFRRYINSRARLVAVATTLAAVGMIATSATALAESASGDKPIPGAAIIRTSDRGVAADGASTAISAPRGTAYSSGKDVSKAAPVVTQDGNQAPLCFANAEFDSAACGLG